MIQDIDEHITLASFRPINGEEINMIIKEFGIKTLAPNSSQHQVD